MSSKKRKPKPTWREKARTRAKAQIAEVRATGFTRGLRVRHVDPQPPTPWTRREPTRHARYLDYLRSGDWQQVRMAYFIAHGRECRGAGPHAGPLQIHHQTYRHLYCEIDHLDDLIALCRSCHARTHGKE